MKIEMPPAPPAHLREQWEGQFSLFSYYAFTIDVPAPLFVVTALKENGLANAALSAWGMPAGSGREPKFILTVHDYTETRKLIEKSGEFVVNYPSLALKKEMRATVNRFDGDTDEILASGLHHEPSVIVKPPRVAECFAHIECRVDWMRGVETGERLSTLVMASVVHAALDDSAARDSLTESHGLRQWVFHISESVNPVNGAAAQGVFAPLDLEHSVCVADFW